MTERAKLKAAAPGTPGASGRRLLRWPGNPRPLIFLPPACPQRPRRVAPGSQILRICWALAVPAKGFEPLTP